MHQWHRSDRKKIAHLTEYCCGPESLLMKRWRQLGGKGTRVSFPEMDASSPNIVDKIVSLARAETRKGKHVRMHVSLPCKAWSKLSRIAASRNEKAAKARLYAQNRSRKMLRHVLRVVQKLQGSHFACSFEWPEGCDGFDERQCPEIKQLKKLLPFETSCHGCAYGLMGP